jgi:hypothetical protein
MPTCAMTWERCSNCRLCVERTRDVGGSPTLVLLCRVHHGSELVIASCPVGERGEAPVAPPEAPVPKKRGRKPGTVVKPKSPRITA